MKSEVPLLEDTASKIIWDHAADMICLFAHIVNLFDLYGLMDIHFTLGIIMQLYV